MIKGAIFDLDGTLIDSMKEWDNLGANFLKSMGIEVEENFNDKIAHMHTLDASKYIIETYGLDDSAESLVVKLKNHMRRFYEFEFELKEGVFKTLEMFKSKKIKMTIATATERELVELVLKRTGIFDFFDTIFTCDEVGQNKSKPTIYLRALESMNLDKQNVFVFEDTIFGVKTPKKAGFKVVAIEDESSRNFKTEIENLADIYLHSWNDFQEMFLK